MSLRENIVIKPGIGQSLIARPNRVLLVDRTANVASIIEIAGVKGEGGKRSKYARGPRLVDLSILESAFTEGRVVETAYQAPGHWSMLDDEYLESAPSDKEKKRRVWRLGRRDASWAILEPIIKGRLIRDLVAENVWGDEFILYFLGLMNLGIPVLLMGNPLAFTELDTSAQLLRRFAMHGWHELAPAKKDIDSWWNDEFLPGATRFTLCEEMPPIAAIRAATSDIDGGVPGIFMAIWKEAQKISLRRGGVSSQLTIGDLEAAASSPSVKKLLEVARAVSTGNADARFVDLPGHPKVIAKREPFGVAPVDPGAVGEALAQVSRRLKQEESKQARKKERDKALMKALSEDDLRRTVGCLRQVLRRASGSRRVGRLRGGSRA